MAARQLLPFQLEPDSGVVKAAQLEAERLVALLRIGVALGLFLAVFLAVTDIPQNSGSHITRQVALASATLGCYVLLGLFSLWLLHRGWFRTWMIWVVATADCSFMLLNSWFSLMNAGFPGKFLFGLPSVWLAPMVLAFAVLRFNPAIQIYSVALVVLGLGAMLFVAPLKQPKVPIERLSIALELPPNLVRLAMIALAGAVLVVAALRMRDLLRRSIEEAQKKANLTRYLPAQLADDMAVQDPSTLRKGRNQNAAVLFVDIRAFTRWSEGRAPDEVGSFITDFRRRIEAAVRRHDGIVDKYMGDAAMVFFVDENAAKRALKCGADILTSIEIWSEERVRAGDDPVTVGVGLHYGTVFVGVVGTRNRLEYTVLGDTVNVASRLQEKCKSALQPFLVSEAVLHAAYGEDAPARKGWTALRGEPLRGRTGDIALFGRVPEAKRA